MPYRLIPPGQRGNRFWAARGSVGGRRIEISTRQRSKADAERVALQLFAKFDKMSRPARHDDATFGEAAALYRACRALSHAEDWRLRRIEIHLAHMRLTHMTPAVIDRFGLDLYPKPGQSASRNRNVRTPIRTVLRLAVREGWIDPVAVKKERETVPLMPAPTTDQVQRLIAGAEGPLRLLLVWIFGHGQRISMALLLDWVQVDLEAATFRFEDTKIRAWRIAPIHAAALSALQDIPPSNRQGFVFPWRTRWAVYTHLDRLAQATGVRFRPHQARRAFARTLARLGVPTHTAQEAGGWQDSRSIARYIGSDPERARDAVNRIPLPGRPSG